MDADSGELDFGDLSDESFDFKEISWKVHNVLSLPETVGYFVQSPSFSFAGATWALRMYPYGHRKKSQSYIELAITRLNSEIPQHYLFYRFGFKTRRGKECETCLRSSLFQNNPHEWVVPHYLQKVELMKKKDNIAPKGILTITCQVRTKKIAAIDKFCQIETAASQLGKYIEISFYFT